MVQIKSPTGKFLRFIKVVLEVEGFLLLGCFVLVFPKVEKMPVKVIRAAL